MGTYLMQVLDLLYFRYSCIPSQVLMLLAFTTRMKNLTIVCI